MREINININVYIYIYSWNIITIDYHRFRQLPVPKKQDAAHEPECNHAEHFCETSYLKILHFSPVTVPVHCRLWNAEEGGVQSVECGV